jgi:hypothetical protein
VLQARADGDVGEGAVAIVLEEAAMRLLALGKSFQPPAVDQKQIEPSVVVVVVEGQAAAGGFKQILVLEFAAVDGLPGKAGFGGDLNKLTPSGVPSMGDFGPGGGGAGLAS